MKIIGIAQIFSSDLKSRMRGGMLTILYEKL